MNCLAAILAVAAAIPGAIVIVRLSQVMIAAKNKMGSSYFPQPIDNHTWTRIAAIRLHEDYVPVTTLVLLAGVTIVGLLLYAGGIYLLGRKLF